MLQKLLDLRLKKRLRTGSAITIVIGSVATILALVMMLYMGSRYTYVLNHYAFPQGDLGYFMTALADVRSATRGAIGYEEQYYIDEMVALHDEKVELMYTYLELVEKGVACDLGEIERDITERDTRDMNREIAPLKQADDAVFLDSSDMTIDEVVEKIKSLCK